MSIRSRTLALLGALMLVATACGDDGAEGGAGEDDGGATTTLSVTAEDFQFSETELSVDAGASVELTFANEGDVAHTFTAEAVGADVVADPGTTETVSFDAGEDASIAFMCRFHPQMTGTIVVGAGGSETSGDSGGGGADDDIGVDY